LYKIRNNGNLKTIAVSGAADKRKQLLSQRLSEQYQMLLFDKIQKHCQTSTTHFWQTITILISKKCLASASWEADIIILSGFALTMRVVRKVKKVATAKIIIIMENDDEFTKSINASSSTLFSPFKIVEIINLNGDKVPRRISSRGA
jgi:hypothetical protein